MIDRLYESKAWDVLLGAAVGFNVVLALWRLQEGEYGLATVNLACAVIVSLAWLMRVSGLRGWRQRQAEWAVIDSYRKEMLALPARVEVAQAEEGYTVLVTRVSGEVDVLRMPEEIDPTDPEEAVPWVLEQLRGPPPPHL